MTLQDWSERRWILPHRTCSREILELLAGAESDLADARTPGLSANWRLNIAYNAATRLSIAALAAAGYRACRDARHHWALQSLAHTVGADTQTVAELDQFRKKRNLAVYERAGSASDQEADEMIGLAARLKEEVAAWLTEAHPELLDPPANGQS